MATRYAMEKKEAYKFTSQDAENYDYYLGPVFFEPYGEYLTKVIDTENLSTVLELASGTGRVTRHIRQWLPARVELHATDLSADMLGIAKRRLGEEGVNYSEQDIQNLSFADDTFDLVICQFGMMFLPDKQKGFNEIYRVLKPGGKFLCFTWDETLKNPVFGLLINELMLPVFQGEDNSRFLVPFSLYQPQQLTNWMTNAGFKGIRVETIARQSGPASPEHLEAGMFRKHPLGKAVMEKDHAAFEPMARQFRDEIEKRYGSDEISFPMSALLTVGLK